MSTKVNPKSELMRLPRRPHEGDLRVYYIINPPSELVEFPVNNPAHGAILIEALAESQLLNPAIQSNVFGLAVFEDGEWCDWYSEDGENLREWAEAQEKAGKLTLAAMREPKEVEG